MAGSGVDRYWAGSSTSTRRQHETAGQDLWPRSGTRQGCREHRSNAWIYGDIPEITSVPARPLGVVSRRCSIHGVIGRLARSEIEGMTTLTVWKFDSEGGARNALQVLERLQKQELIQIVDGAIVTWPPDRKKPKTEQLRSLTGAGVLGGAFWGLL